MTVPLRHHIQLVWEHEHDTPRTVITIRTDTAEACRINLHPARPTAGLLVRPNIHTIEPRLIVRPTAASARFVIWPSSAAATATTAGITVRLLEPDSDCPRWWIIRRQHVGNIYAGRGCTYAGH